MRRLARLFRKHPNAVGMAMWRESEDGIPMRSCTLYLRDDATYDVLAHEARHCLEGHFHPPGLYAGLGGPPLPAVRRPEGGFPRQAPQP
ncbi:MAG: hypothetical protein QNJ94_08230 [Alphaproteobacteria bacterium]|nr:hypothetical protein [Alphaproteobacteria bacterium]